MTLLVGAFLLVGTLRHLAAVPLGFDARGLYIFMLQPAAVGYDDARSLAYLDEFRRRLRSRREFGIRAALGASRGDVWRLVLRESATIIGAGVALGLGGAYAFAQVLSARLVGVNALDPALWSMAVGVLALVAIAASLKPAFAATRLNVSDTLRAV